MARYVSREIQRQFARLMIEAGCTEEQLDAAAILLDRNNGSPAGAFRTYYLERVNERD